MKQNHLHAIIAGVLIAVLSFPYLAEIYHSTRHDHATVHGEQTDTQIHQDQLDCSLDDLQLSPYTNIVFVGEFNEITSLETELVAQYNSLISNTLHTRLRDRGPPCFLL